MAQNDGRLEDAKRTLLLLTDESNPSGVTGRAIFSLANLLTRFPDDTIWLKLEPKLKLLGRYWQARRYLAIYGLTPENAERRVKELETALEQDQPVARRLEDEIILSDVLRRCGRQTEARLLTAAIEKETGEKVVDGELRVQYVRICAGIASEQSRNGDLNAGLRLHQYQIALGEMYEPH